MRFNDSQMYTLLICLCGFVLCAAENLVFVTDFSPPAIYYATLGQNLKFRKINVHGGRRNITAPAAIDYDPVERRIYWTQGSSKWTGQGLIARCDLKGNFYQELIKELEYAVGLALDTVGRRMYFSHEGLALESAKLDGTDRRDVVRELPTSGFFIFFDPIGKRIYWSDSTKKDIESARPNGSNRTVHLTNLQHPADIYVDSKARQIFWTDFGVDRISTSNTKGENVRTLYQYPLVTVQSEPRAIAVTLDNEIYWVDRNHARLQKIPKNIRKGQVVVPKDVGNVEFGWPSGLHIYQVGGSDHLRSASVVVYLVVPMLFQLLLKL